MCLFFVTLHCIQNPELIKWGYSAASRNSTYQTQSCMALYQMHFFSRSYPDILHISATQNKLGELQGEFSS